MDLALLQSLNAARAAREAAILVTDTASGAVRLVVEKNGYAGDPLAAELVLRFRSGKSGTVLTPDGTPAVPHRASAAAAPHRHRRGPHQPGAGADGAGSPAST